MSWFSQAWGDATQTVQQTWDTVVSSVLNDAGIPNRGLRAAEMGVARSVFHSSVPLGRVVLLAFTGLNGRPFTLPGSMLVAVATMIKLPAAFLLTPVLAAFADKYLIFIGKGGYNDGLSGFYFKKQGDVLVHELTHVWQGHNSAFPWWYVFNSVYNQCLVGAHAYDYTLGAAWDTYGAEQQAEIVQDWFAKGASISDERFAYIACNIWPGKPHAPVTNLPVALLTAGLRVPPAR